jgi:TIR domain.
MIEIYPVKGVYPFKVFTAYSHRDEEMRELLETHLATLKKSGIIEVFHDRRIVPGQDWQRELDTHLLDSDVFLPLVSADFIASDYCFGVELKTALARQEAGEIRVIPIILRPCDWRAIQPLSALQALPTDARPISKWEDPDDPYVNVVEGLRAVVEQLRSRPVPTELTLSWSPTALVIARVNKILNGRIARAPSSLMLVLPDQGVLNDSLLAAAILTDVEGAPAKGVPITFSISGGRIAPIESIGDQDPSQTSHVGTGTISEEGLSVVKIWVDEPQVTVSVSAAGYSTQVGAFTAAHYID